MHTKRIVLLCFLLLLAFWLGAQGGNPADCVVKTSSEWGTPCEQCWIYDGYRRDFSGTYSIELKNTCKEMVDVKVAVQERSGNWRIFPMRTLMPQETMNAYACQGTGKYLYWVRRTDDPEIRMPTDAEIITEYRER